LKENRLVEFDEKSIPKNTNIYESSPWGWFALRECSRFNIQPNIRQSNPLGEKDTADEEPIQSSDIEDFYEFEHDDEKEENDNGWPINIYYSKALLRYFLVEVMNLELEKFRVSTIFNF